MAEFGAGLLYLILQIGLFVLALQISIKAAEIIEARVPWRHAGFVSGLIAFFLVGLLMVRLFGPSLGALNHLSCRHATDMDECLNPSDYDP